MSTPRKFAEAYGMEAVFITTRFLLTPGTDENGRNGLSDKTMNALCKIIWDAAQPAIQKAIDDGGLPDVRFDILMAEGGFIDAAYPSEKAMAKRAKRNAEREQAKAVAP